MSPPCPPPSLTKALDELCEDSRVTLHQTPLSRAARHVGHEGFFTALRARACARAPPSQHQRQSTAAPL